MLVSFSIFPVGSGESLSPHVAKVIEIVRKSGLPHKLGAMSTVIEGGWEEIFSCLNKCREKLRADNSRVYLVITVDDRGGAAGRLRGKIRSVEKKLKKGERPLAAREKRPS